MKVYKKIYENKENKKVQVLNQGGDALTDDEFLNNLEKHTEILPVIKHIFNLLKENKTQDTYIYIYDEEPAMPARLLFCATQENSIVFTFYSPYIERGKSTQFDRFEKDYWPNEKQLTVFDSNLFTQLSSTHHFQIILTKEYLFYTPNKKPYNGGVHQLKNYSLDGVLWRLIIQSGGGEGYQVRNLAFSGMRYMLELVDEDSESLEFGLNWAKNQHKCYYREFVFDGGDEDDGDKDGKKVKNGQNAIIKLCFWLCGMLGMNTKTINLGDIVKYFSDRQEHVLQFLCGLLKDDAYKAHSDARMAQILQKYILEEQYTE